MSVRTFVARQAVSELFSVTLRAVSTDPDLDLERILGKPASLRTNANDKLTALEGERHWSGICNAIELERSVKPTDGSHPVSTYRLSIVPDIWLLTQRREMRIYQHLSIPDIVDKLLEEWAVKCRWNIDRDRYPKLEFKVQYGESDYHFVSRLLEDAGICFTFPNDNAAGSIVTFSDQLQTNPPRPGAPLSYVDNRSSNTAGEYVTDIRLTREVRSGAYTLRDYDFRAPAFELFAHSPKRSPEERFEQYHYLPGATLVEGGKAGSTPAADDRGVARHNQKYGLDRAERALHGSRVGRETVHFVTGSIDIWPGMVLSFDHHPHADVAQKLLVLGFTIEGNVEGKEWTISGHAVFAKRPYRPPLRTEKPRIFGVQTATVVGPRGQEIHTDEFGRVRVQFPWDREGRADEKSSCWMRVSQGWAGTGFGMMNVPRIGQEVLVGFLTGDPDQPIVVGRVFNAVEQVPYKLPDNKTVSGWKTNTTPGGGGYNEIKLEDKAGKELFYVQAQRNYDELIKNDETQRTLANHRKTVVQNQDLIVKQTKKELINIDDHLHVEGNRMQHIDKTTSLTVGVDQHESIGRNHALEAGQEVHIKAGAHVIVEAGARLTIRGPGGFVDIHSGGVDIVGKVVNINSGGSAGKGSGASPKLPADAQEAQPQDSSS